MLTGDLSLRDTLLDILFFSRLYCVPLYLQVGLVGDDGVVRMVREVVDKEEREALEAKVVEEEARDKEAEASKDYTGLIPEVAFFSSFNSTMPIL